MSKYLRLARLKDPQDFEKYLQDREIDLPFDHDLMAGEDNPLRQPYYLGNNRSIGNRFCTLPMEGWDGTGDGKPSEYTTRRWKRFGRSGAKLIWGGEAVAVRYDGRANPNQLLLNAKTASSLEQLREDLPDEHLQRYGTCEDLIVGLQLTHSGRFSRPNEKDRLEPLVLFHHPYLDEHFKIPPDHRVMTDHEIEGLIGDFVSAAKLAQEIGFDFVDIKHCHGYLGHEFLSARMRSGPYGGSFQNRTRFLREIVGGIRRECKGLMIGVRLSTFDFPPFIEVDGCTVPLVTRREGGQYPVSFGMSPQDPLQIDLEEPVAFLSLLEDLDIQLVCLTAGCPYYNPHIVRPAYFHPSDGYPPPEDPLVGVARQIGIVATLKSRFPKLAIVGSAYSYLQEWLPHVAQRVVREGKADFIGLGRMMLSYPEFAADILAGVPLDRKRICRTFSDCTTAPRHGLVSGCYSLDPFFKGSPSAAIVKGIQAQIVRRTSRT
jgi:NADPH2 dehydrogenase